VVSPVGLQHTTIYASGRRETFFVEKNRVKDVVINEGITMHRVLFYLAIILRSGPPDRRKEPGETRDRCKDETTGTCNGVVGMDPTSKLKDFTDSSDENESANGVQLEREKSRITSDDVIYPLFQSLWPRLDILCVIYSGVQTTLFKSVAECVSN
jgi:hypothetical protein